MTKKFSAAYESKILALLHHDRENDVTYDRKQQILVERPSDFAWYFEAIPQAFDFRDQGHRKFV